MIILGILVLLAGVGIMWLWQYAYTPQGRARIIIAQLKNDPSTLRGWMLQHHVVRPGFTEPPHDAKWNSTYPTQNQFAAEDEMVQLGREVLPIVVEALKDENFDVRMMAVMVAADFGDSTAIPQLIARLQDSNEFVRTQAAAALGEFKDKRVVDALVRNLSNTDMINRDVSAIALGKIGDPQAIPSLLKTFGDTENEHPVRTSAAAALAKMGKEEGAQYLLAMVKSSNWSDRLDVAESLREIQFKGAIEPLLSLLADRNLDVRAQAVLAAGDLQDPRAIPSVKKLLNDTDPEVRDSAAAALQKLGVKLPPASQPAATGPSGYMECHPRRGADNA